MLWKKSLSMNKDNLWLGAKHECWNYAEMAVLVGLQIHIMSKQLYYWKSPIFLNTNASDIG